MAAGWRIPPILLRVVSVARNCILLRWDDWSQFPGAEIDLVWSNPSQGAVLSRPSPNIAVVIELLQEQPSPRQIDRIKLINYVLHPLEFSSSDVGKMRSACVTSEYKEGKQDGISDFWAGWGRTRRKLLTMPGESLTQGPKYTLSLLFLFYFIISFFCLGSDWIAN